jgi:hypothetical protein
VSLARCFALPVLRYLAFVIGILGFFSSILIIRPSLLVEASDKFHFSTLPNDWIAERAR